MGSSTVMLARAPSRSSRAAALGGACVFFCVVGGGALGCRARGTTSTLVVDVAWDGASAAAVDAQLAPLVERALAGLDVVYGTHVTAHARAGSLRVVAPLRQEAARATEEVERALARVSWPAGAGSPTLALDSADRMPVARILVRGDTASVLEASSTRDRLADLLRSVPAVAEVRTSGGALREVQVTVDGARAQARGVTPAHIASVLRGAPLPAPESLGQIVVRGGPEPVLVRDVATVADGMRNVEAGPALPIAIEVVKLPGETPPAAVVAAAVVDVLRAYRPPDGVTVVPAPLQAGMTVAAVAPVAKVPEHVVAALRSAGFEVPPPGRDDVRPSLTIDRARAEQRGVAVEDAELAVRFALSGVVIGELAGVDHVPVRVSQPIDEHAPLGQQLHVATRTGELVPLAAIAEERLTAEPKELLRVAGTRGALLCARTSGAPSKAQLDAVTAASAAAPPGTIVDAGPLARALCRR